MAICSKISEPSFARLAVTDIIRTFLRQITKGGEVQSIHLNKENQIMEMINIIQYLSAYYIVKLIRNSFLSVH